MYRLKSARLVALSLVAVSACTEEPLADALPWDSGVASTHDSGAVPGGTGGVVGAGGLGSPGGPGGAGGGDAAPLDNDVVAGSSLPCDIQKIVVEKCQACHSDPPIGTFMPLVTAAHFQKTSTIDPTKKYSELAKQRISATSNPMPPVTSPSLTPDEKTKLTAWLSAGAPAGTQKCAVTSTDAGTDAGTVVDAGPPEDLTCYKFLAHADGDKTKKYKVGAQKDGYWLFGFQAPWQGIAYAQILRPVIDNSKVLHHWLLYKEIALDGSIRKTIGQHEVGELLAGWAPGGVTMDFRTQGDVSMELPAESYAIELHYNSDDPNAEDASGVEICAKTKPTKNIASMSWVGYDMGGTLSYASGVCLTPAKIWTGVCKPAATEPIHLLFMVPHMHTTGRNMKSVINGPNGSRVLHDKPFDFNYQVTFATDEVLMPGESITTTCTFSEDKCAGQSTTQEMCYNFMYAYPKHALTDLGLEGTFIHGNGACLGQ
jgi:hypothetical protein